MMKIKDLEARAEKAYSLLENCAVCPRKCGVNRQREETGFCGVGEKPKVASCNVHYGEEPPYPEPEDREPSSSPAAT